MKQMFFSFLHWLLIKKCRIRSKNWFFSSLWYGIWNFSINKYKGTIDFKLHSEKVKMNNGYPYPLFINTFYNYNHPLIEVVYLVSKLKNRPIDYVDIGSAIGDTMLLLFKTCPKMINFYYSIDGDEEFFKYQKYNLRNYPNGKLIKALLSDVESINEKSLIRTHLGTASAQGNYYEEAITLDKLLKHNDAKNIDLIKIDVDGLDGKVLSGAKETLEKYKPSVIFEWHPILIHKTQNDYYQAFQLLSQLGYNKFIFFSKYGHFNHVQCNINKEEIDFMVNLCLNNKYDEDWHYDIISIHDSTELNLLDLAELNYSNKL